MKTVAVICEYNPFHNGHARQLRQMAAVGTTVCVMSGNYVQRGEPAICDKWTRARAAALCGADLVLELPVTYALRSAEGFADGGVEAEYYIDGSNGAYIFSAGNFDLMYGAYSVPFASDLYDLYHDDRYVSEDMKPTLKERYTDLQYQWKTTLDPVQQKAIVDQLQYNGMEDMLCIPLYTMSSVTVINSGHFQGFPAHSTDWMSMYDPHTERWQILP